MRTGKVLFARWRGGQRILFAALLLALISLPACADIVSVQGSGLFARADTGGIDLVVNPDGSVVINDQQDFAGSFSFDFAGGDYGSAGSSFVPPLPPLPPGATINSETLRFLSVSLGLEPTAGNLVVNPQGPLTVTSVTLGNCNGCTFSPPFASSYPVDLVMPLPPGEVYDLEVSGADGGGLVYSLPPFALGEYSGGANVEISASWEIDVNYSVAPEPRTIGLIALGMIAPIAIKAHNRLQRTTS